MNWLYFIGGMFLGSFIGVGVMCMVVMGRDGDDSAAQTEDL